LQFLFCKERAKDKMAEIVRKAAEFSGIKIEAFAMMDNHFHVLCTVVRTGEKESADEVVRRVRILKGDKAADAFAERLSELAGLDATLEAELDRFRSRMNDISGFMKTAKELFAIWYNREFGYSGSVWEGVFKSTMVEGGEYLERCRKYILLNPVRAGVVNQTKDYRWAWSAAESAVLIFTGCLSSVGYSGCFYNGDEALARRMVQLGEGKIYGSEAFVRRWVVGLGELFVARRVGAHEVSGMGYSSHGWRIAKRRDRLELAEERR